MVPIAQNLQALLIFTGWRQEHIRLLGRYLIIGLSFDLSERSLKEQLEERFTEMRHTVMCRFACHS